MTRKERYTEVISYFEKNMPVAETELNYTSPFELLVAVVLSAQCTDKRVNRVTPALFEAYPTPEAMANAPVEEVFALIKSISYPNNKAKHLVGLAQKLIAEFGGNIPEDLEQLQTLPGVGRKTANVLGVVLFDLPVMPVDTHVFRVARRIGLSAGTTPIAVEKDLTNHFPDAVMPQAHHWLILHGRYTCMAKNPRCTDCGLNNICKNKEN